VQASAMLSMNGNNYAFNSLKTILSRDKLLQASKNDVGFDNCVGAFDGLLICSEKLTEKFAHMMKTGSRSFYCGQKCQFGYNMQVVCDAEGCFLSVWINHPALASDFISFIQSKLYSKLTSPGFLADGLVAPANFNDLSVPEDGAANAAATIETENRNNVSQLIDGGQHFQDVTDEEWAAEQSYPLTNVENS
jgi:hypothetical protein